MKSMSKSVNNLWNFVFNIESLYRSFYEIKRGNKRLRDSYLKFEMNLFEYLDDILFCLNNDKWIIRKPNRFYVYEPKIRPIDSAPLYEKIIHRTLYNGINPLFESIYIKNSFACRKNKGTLAGSTELMNQIKSFKNKSFYYIDGDIYHYFHSINQRKLLELIKRRIRDKKIIGLIEKIVYLCPIFKNGTGIPLGFLTSQMFANIYLNQLDQFVLNTLKVNKYTRYMDDFNLLLNTKIEAIECLKKIKNFLFENLSLELNPKTSIQKYDENRGLYFAGYVNFSTYRKPRKINIKKFKKKFKFNQELTKHKFASLNSVLGYLQWCSKSETLEYFQKIKKEFHNSNK